MVYFLNIFTVYFHVIIYRIANLDTEFLKELIKKIMA